MSMSTQRFTPRSRWRSRVYGLRPVALALAPFEVFWAVAVGGMVYGTVATRTLQLGVIPESWILSLLLAVSVHAWRKPLDTPAPIGIPGTIISYAIRATIGMAFFTGVAVVALSTVTP